MAFDGMISGRNLLIVPKRLIVQSWRSGIWKRTDPDSILVLRFSRAPGGAKVSLVHVNVPNYDHARFTKGWHKHYWNPWKTYLKNVVQLDGFQGPDGFRAQLLQDKQEIEALKKRLGI